MRVWVRSTDLVTSPTLLAARLWVSLRLYFCLHYWQNSGVLGSNAKFNGCVIANQPYWICRDTRHQGPRPAGFTPSNVDLLSQISTSKVELRTSVQLKWIKGHQSLKTLSNKDVDRNYRVDKLATSYREQQKKWQLSKRIDHISETRVSIRINGICQVGQVEACLRFHINGYHMWRYLQHWHEWPVVEHDRHENSWPISQVTDPIQRHGSGEISEYPTPHRNTMKPGRKN